MPKLILRLFAELLKQNPPHTIDWNIVEQLEKIGIVVGEDFDFSALDPATQAKLEASTAERFELNYEQKPYWGLC